MISFDTDGHRFNLRAVAVILSGDHVLMHRPDRDEYWSLPGGRVEAGEDAVTAVAREMRDELGIAVTVGRLLWVVENFFASGGRPYHEIGLMRDPASNASPHFSQGSSTSISSNAVLIDLPCASSASERVTPPPSACPSTKLNAPRSGSS